VRIYDTFLFSGELDMLEARLYELQDTDVYRHVIIEAGVTFQGRPKPFYYRENQERFAPWKDRIRYVAADLASRDTWGREHESRELAFRGLKDAEPQDVIIHADVDEFPLASAMPQIAEVRNRVKFHARCAVFAADWELPWPWTAPSVARYDSIASFTRLRENESFTILDAPAWHLSWLGGPEAMKRKVNSFSHTEVIDWVTAGIDAGEYYERGLFWGTPHGAKGQTQLIAREVDETWPRWIYEKRCPSTWLRPRSVPPS